MNSKLVAGVAILIFFIVIGYLFFTSQVAGTDIPPHVTGEMRDIYEWAKTPQGVALLESMPCYCGCKYEGHLHTRHCFWKDDGSFDKHGITCSVCLDIAKKVRAMNADGKTVCEIRQAVEAIFNVKVSAVRTSTMEGKLKRMGRHQGRRPSWKKALVTLAPGHKIELVEGV
jgi:ribosomal protein L23